MHQRSKWVRKRHGHFLRISDFGRSRDDETSREPRVERDRCRLQEECLTSGAPSTSGPFSSVEPSRPGVVFRRWMGPACRPCSRTDRVERIPASTPRRSAPSNRLAWRPPDAVPSTSRRILCLHSLVWIGPVCSRLTVRIRCATYRQLATAAVRKNRQSRIGHCKHHLCNLVGSKPTRVRGSGLRW